MAHIVEYKGTGTDKDGKKIEGLNFRLVTFNGDIEAAKTEILKYHRQYKSLELTETQSKDVDDSTPIEELVKPTPSTPIAPTAAQ